METAVAIAAAEAVLPGRDLPGSRLSNHRLSALMQDVAGEFRERGIRRDVPISSLDFPESRIGIRSRCVLDESLTTRDLAVAAAQRVLQASGIEPSAIRCVVVSTVTADRVVPALATTVHNRLGLSESTPAFDLCLGCNGFLNALDVAQRFLTGQPEGAAALVIGADAMTRVLDASDRATCSVFGDGGGAIVLRRTATPGMTPVRAATFGDRGDCIEIRADASDEPLFRFTSEAGLLSVREDFQCRRRVRMAGRRVFRDMLRLIPSFIASYLDEHHFGVADVDAFVFHQANLRIIEGVAKAPGLRIPPHKLLHNIGEVGNTTNASIPILLGEAVHHGWVRPGGRVLLVGFGTGYSLGITLLTWH